MNMSRAVAAPATPLPEPFVVEEDLRDLLPATAVALVKGAWSKFVTFDELMIELFFAKLLSTAPELATQSLMSWRSSVTDRWVERRSFLVVSSENQRSTWFSQEL